jgi:hypothetical protein
MPQTKITSAQFDRIARAIDGQNVTHVAVKSHPHAISYQIHYADGTFGSWVTIQPNGDFS